MGTEPPPETTGQVFPLPGKGSKTLPDVKYWVPDPKPLSTDVIQHGVTYTSRVKNEHASCGGASMMAPLLKHWTALPALSHFLTNAMHIRESSRRIVVPSTFKPPPRVTMPDQKRAQWLMDLANPQVPLRKLGRTVPGGLTGGDLIQQLYHFRVPLFRSLWLIKCVGASELRTLRRKIQQSGHTSQTPEKIWLQEWTANVLAKLEEVVAEFGSDPQDGGPAAAWPEKICYTLDTVAALFTEGLIDQALLTTWTLGQLDSGPPHSLPATINLANKIWPALVMEPVAVRLASALCLRSTKLSPAARKTLHVVDALLLRLFDACPDAFILPELWPQLEAQLRRATTLPALFTKVARSQQDTQASIDAISKRNAIFMVSQETPLSAQWHAQTKIDKILSGFCIPYSVPALINQLQTLNLPVQDLFDALMSWTLRRANDRATHLTLAISQQLAIDSPIDDYLVAYLMDLRPSHSSKTLYRLLGWFYKSSIFSVEKYFRRLIASGIMHLSGPRSRTHKEILKNLPFSLMTKPLKGQVRMLIRDDIEDRSSTVPDLTAQSRLLYSQPHPTPLDLSNASLLRDQELRLSDAIFQEYRHRLAENDSSSGAISPLLLSALLKTIDSLSDKYTVFRIIWLTLASNTTSHALYVYAHSVCTQYTYFLLCMRVIPALVQVMYDRRSYHTLNIQHSFETSGIVLMLRAALQDKPESKLFDSYLKSIETLYVPPNMTPENEETQIDGASGTKLMSAALNAADTQTLLRLGKHMLRRQFVQLFGEWLERTPDASTNLIAWLLTTFYIYFSDVYNLLVDKRNNLLYRLLFDPPESFGLEELKQEYLHVARQTFIMVSPPDEVLYILSTVQDPYQLAKGIQQLLQRTRYNSDTCSDMLFNFKPDSSEKLECLKMLVQDQIGLDLRHSRDQCFLHLLELCNAFNTGFCQIGCWLTFKDMAPKETVEVVLGVLKSGRILDKTSSWQVIFSLLDAETKSALHAAAEAEFLTGPVPNPNVDHLLLILMSLEQFSQSASRVHDHASELINYLGRITNACKLRTVDAAAIEPTLLLILKLLVIECAPSDVPTGDAQTVPPTLDSEYSNVILPTVAALCTGLQESPVVQESGRLSSMVADALRILNRREDNANAPTFNVLNSSLSGLMMFSRSHNTYTNLDAWPFDLIEENASGSGNDVPLDLSRFETYVEIKDTS